MGEFVAIAVQRSAGDFEQEAIELIRSYFPEWEPAEGDLETLILRIIARISSILGEQASTITAAAFARFGEKIANVPPIAATPATVSSDWTFIDNAGYTVPAGTQVGIQATGETSIGFVVVEDLVVAPGSDEATGVNLRAIEPGTQGNALTGPAGLIDSLAFVDTITLDGTTAGGVDDETEDEYLDRLTLELQTLSLTLNVPRDFEIDAISKAGVERAICIRGYDLDTETPDTPLCVTVVPIDANGAGFASLFKEELQEAQAAKVLSGVLNFVGDPDYTKFDVEAVVTIAAGFSPAAVLAAVKAALGEYLSPANWGRPASTTDPGSSGGWVLEDKLYRNELISVVDQVPGVGRVVTLKLAEHGKGLAATEEIALKGIAPLSEAGTLTVKSE